ncbi:MAG: nucleotide excision repair endonuclease [bacterium]|nr:nucleotide excision repair endonuclease [bacterium]
MDWSRYEFDAALLRSLPRVPGTYRFFDRDEQLIYVGKSKNLRDRVASYFREDIMRRPERVQKLLDRLYRIEFDAAGSDLEAMLREAEQIRRDKPSENVQRRIDADAGRGARLHSILILEPAEPPAVLRAYMIRHGRLIDRVKIGPRGGGLKRIERVLDDYFFFVPSGPTTVEGPDLDVEIVARWLASNRDSVVAFDPTDLKSAKEVIERLRWFLGQGSPFDADGSPVFRR